MRLLIKKRKINLTLSLTRIISKLQILPLSLKNLIIFLALSPIKFKVRSLTLEILKSMSKNYIHPILSFFPLLPMTKYQNFLKHSIILKVQVVLVFQNKFLTGVPETLADILQNLINLTFETSIFPNALKTVKVIPIFKNKGSNQNVDNYRPIHFYLILTRSLKN